MHCSYRLQSNHFFVDKKFKVFSFVAIRLKLCFPLLPDFCAFLFDFLIGIFCILYIIYMLCIYIKHYIGISISVFQ